MNYVAIYFMINWLCIKIASGKNNEFTIKTKLKLVVLEIVMVDRIDEIYKVDEIRRLIRVNKINRSNTFKKHKESVLSL